MHTIHLTHLYTKTNLLSSQFTHDNQYSHNMFLYHTAHMYAGKARHLIYILDTPCQHLHLTVVSIV